MFQDFRRRTSPETGADRLAALRRAMQAEGLDIVLVPRADAHQGENVAPSDERLAWLTAFTGSAGLAVVTQDRAAIFVDGRYGLQLRSEVDLDCFEPRRHPEETPADWLTEAMQGGGRIGFDPWLHTQRDIERLEDALAERQVTLVPVDNPVDRVWRDRPAPPAEPIVPHPMDLAGQSSADKRADIARDLTAQGIAAAVLTLPDSIAWLLNIRGSDIARTPVPRAFAILHGDGKVALFIDPAQAGDTLRDHLGPDVTILPRDEFGPALEALSGRVAIDRDRAPVWVANRVTDGGGEIVWARDPCILPKARKNPVEIAGMRAAHLRDAVAIVECLAWLDAHLPEGTLSEIDVVRRLEQFRRETGALRDISFETIAGSGPNGAIVHYRVDDASDRRVAPGDLLLIDSGAQYADGTTDITRTIAAGPPPPGAIRPFTLVLRGLIAMSRLHWPPELEGRHLDAIARAPLWAAGLDYDHGTGHGVGAYLGVHEGPQGLARRYSEPLCPGMILSIEPGYYREGAFGIRIENLVVVSPTSVSDEGEREMLTFETLTLAPIDRRLIDRDLLEPSERAWLDAYHARVAEALAPLVTPDTARWLHTACAPI